MLAVPSNIWSRKIILGLVVLIIVAATTAASSDFHSDLRPHQDCVLCSLAQLALVLPLSDFNLPPPVPAGWEACLVQAFQTDTLRTESTLVRGPPA